MVKFELSYTPLGVGLNLVSLGNENRYLAVEAFRGWFKIWSGVDTITDKPYSYPPYPGAFIACWVSVITF